MGYETLQNLDQFEQVPEETVANEPINSMPNDDIEFGTTEYILVTIWAAFTAIVFLTLYKISKEVGEE